MTKVVINRKMGGCFIISYKAADRLVELGFPEEKLEDFIDDGIIINEDEEFECRTNPILIKVIEELGNEANVKYESELKVVEIPNNVNWVIRVGSMDDVDNGVNIEYIEEKHRVWTGE